MEQNVMHYYIWERHPEREDTLLGIAYGKVAAEWIIKALQKMMDNPSGEGILICQEQHDPNAAEDADPTYIHTNSRNHPDRVGLTYLAQPYCVEYVDARIAEYEEDENGKDA